MSAGSQMTIRIAANVDELRKNLLEGKASIEALGPSVESLAKKWTAHSTTIVQDARNVVAAVDKIGDASLLTARDATSALKKLELGMEELTRTGKKVPPEMAATAESLKRIPPHIDAATVATGGLLTKLGPMAATLGIAFSVGAVIRFGQAILDDADAMVKLSDKTGIAIEPLQRLKYAAEQSGNTLEQVTSAVSMMQNRLAGGDASAVKALQDLGIEFSIFKSLNPDKQFMAIAVEVAKIEDPMLRAQIATDLFGKSGREMLPTLLADIEKLDAAAPVMSERATRAFDDIGDALSRVYQVAKNFTGEVAGNMIDSIGRLGVVLASVAGRDLRGVTDALFDLETGALPAAKGLHGVTVASTDLTFSERAVKAAIDDMDASMKDASENAESLQKYITGLVREGEKWDDALIKITSQTHALALAMGRDAVAAANKMAAAINASIVGQLTTLQDYQQKNELALLSGTALKLRQLEIEQAGVMAAAGAQHGANSELYRMMAAEVDTYFARQREVVAGGADHFVQQIQRETVAVQQAALTWSQAMDLVNQGQGTLGGALQNAPLTPERKAATQQAWNAGNYYGPVVGGSPSNPRGSGPDWWALGYRAAGGAVEAMMPYMVGERGPELFVPAMSGTVLPHGAAGGVSVVNHIYVTHPFGTPDAIARVVGDAMMARLRSAGVRLPGA